MILSGFDPRTSRIVRLIGLAFICWSVFVASPHPGTSGRALVVSILFAISVALWLAWLRDSNMEGPLQADTYVLALVGGGLIGASPSSAAPAFVFVAVVAAGLRSDLTHAMQVVALGTLGLAAAVLIYDGGALGLLAYALGFAAAGLAASNLRQFRERADQAELLLAHGQRSQEEQLRAARLEESARIAREIHDVLAHALAGLTIQLEATTMLIESDADRGEILARVRRAHELAREGLRETRRAVGALRGDAVAVPDAIEALAAGYRSAAGRPAQLSIEGDLSTLGADAGLAVLRVVQEALTNVSKHAPGAEVTVIVRAGADGIVATIADRLGAVPVAAGSLAASGGGYGLTGMRERAAALGGTLSAGPAEGGWCVSLRLPAAPAPAPAPTSAPAP